MLAKALICQALLPALQGHICDGRLGAALSLPNLFNMGHDVFPEPGCGKKVDDRVQEAVETHEKQRDLMSVVESLKSVLVPVHVAPALLNLQDCQCPGALDDMVGKETQCKDSDHCQQRLQGSGLSGQGGLRPGTALGSISKN